MNNHYDNRQIRIFISSTFQDMQAERDYLITKVFPHLQIEAAKRGVSVIPLDLRWGVTEEEARTGKVIEICLQEIENSHPFFIGIIGNRYGWCPTKTELEKNEILKERWGEWLEKDIEQGLSVTEIEMQYGVLRSKDELNAFFFIKEGIDYNGANSEKLRKLIKTICDNERYPYRKYDSPEDLGSQIEIAFMDLLEKKYPIEEFSQIQKERLAQSAFLHSRTEAYIANEDDFNLLDTFLGNATQHIFVVTGESGLGKSSLIANWLLRHNNKDNWNIVCHFVGNDNQDTSYYYILKRLIDEINTIYTIEQNWDSGHFNTLKDELEFLLSQINNLKPLLIILDGVNQIVDAEDVKLLNWLPLPTQNVKYIFTTIPDDKTFESLKSRGYPMHILKPLNIMRKRNLVKDYLWKYRKKLTESQIDRIVNNPQNENTLVLRSLLDELVLFGEYNNLDQYISYFLQNNDIEFFFQLLLNRYENDYGRTFVTHVLALISFSRNGLSESEIIKICNCNQLEWSQFYCAFKSKVLIRNGMLTFSHQFIQNAAKHRYQYIAETCRKEIISLFLNDNSSHALDELSYQFYTLNDTDSLYTLLLDFDRFNYFYNKDKYELGNYWAVLKNTNKERYSIGSFLSIPYKSTINDGFILDKIGTIADEFLNEQLLAREIKTKALSLVLQYCDENSYELAQLYKSISITYAHGVEYGLGGRGMAQRYIEKAKAILIKIKREDLSMSYVSSEIDSHTRYFFKDHIEELKEYLRSSKTPDYYFYMCLGDSYVCNYDYNKALKYYFQAFSLCKSTYGQDSIEMAHICMRISGYGIKQMFFHTNYDLQKEYGTKALDIFSNKMGVEYPQTIKLRKEISNLERHKPHNKIVLTLEKIAISALSSVFRSIFPDERKRKKELEIIEKSIEGKTIGQLVEKPQ